MIPAHVMQVLVLLGQMFLLILAGLFLRKKEIISDEGQRCITDVTVSFIIPCNIIKSFLQPIDFSMLRSCALLFFVSAGSLVLFFYLNKFLYRKFPDKQEKIMQYGTLASNSGFLGNPVSEGLYGDVGLLYNSVFLIPVRIVTWSLAVGYFSETPSLKDTVKKSAKHPCLIAVWIGLFIMLSGLKLPLILESTIRASSSATIVMTMLIIGSVLAQVDLKTIFNKGAFYYSFIRLIILPAFVYGACLFLPLDRTAVGIAVLMTAMPCSTTAAIFAARYESDAPFAAKIVMLSTILSAFTLPLWQMIL